MPVNRAAIFQLTLLLLIVPIQYIITQWKPVSDTERSHNLQNLMVKISSWKNKVLSIKTWKQCYENALKYVTGSFEKYAYPDIDEDDTDLGESPAVEVLRYKDKTGHFAASTEPRSPRSRKVKYRIGQVIRHKTWGYRGVIVGWDERAKAPEDWIKQMHGIHKLDQPFYVLLTDARDYAAAMVYIPESDCEILSIHTEIVHPEVQDYFEKFDGTRYLARPWLKQIYPHDQ
ncbi:F-box only protein 21-like isoform X2 [Patiria miniata]|uniref:Hemimethylated DNA-binding domain-containing protein n=1 Tax=Patiria miniata TaxID=46514 RepID=A0A914BRC4_PATMI|nr:F-box only protein 21-like isoform X2 [Patiria miniata]